MSSWVKPRIQFSMIIAAEKTAHLNTALMGAAGCPKMGLWSIVSSRLRPSWHAGLYPPRSQLSRDTKKIETRALFPPHLRSFLENMYRYITLLIFYIFSLYCHCYPFWRSAFFSLCGAPSHTSHTNLANKTKPTLINYLCASLLARLWGPPVCPDWGWRNECWWCWWCCWCWCWWCCR